MKSLKELKKVREREGEALGKLQSRMQEKLFKKREKGKVKEDIRRIKSAKLRAQLGVSQTDVRQIGDRFKNAFKGTGKVLKKSGILIGKGMLGAGEAANKYYGTNKCKRRK